MKCLVTGITGSLGRAVTDNLLARGDYRITGFSRCELKQSQMRRHKNLTLVLGDIRDYRRISEASRGMDILFHFAALKRVDSLEENPEEAIATNIYGTQNVLGSQRQNGVGRVVLSSTDKGALPINVYGCTKQIAEKLVLRNPRNIVCRYGNVLASRGSVIPEFVSAIKARIPVQITDPEMTRFFIRIEDAAEFIVSSSISIDGGLKIPKMKAAKMTDVAAAIGEILNKKVTTEIVGIRPGEKIHECLRMPHEGMPIFSNTATRFTSVELMDLLRPIVAAL